MVEAAAEAKEAVAAEQRAAGVTPHEKPVPLATVLAIIGTPLILILAATFSSIALDPSTLRSVIEFFGNPFVALTIALFLAYYLLGIRRGWSRKSLESVSTSSLKPVGNILLVVGAGGSSVPYSRAAASRTRWPTRSTTWACRSSCSPG
ncbi:hypothetical protein SCYAM73S_05437 [Streptomyces cyaneofuscatus]